MICLTFYPIMQTLISARDTQADLFNNHWATLAVMELGGGSSYGSSEQNKADIAMKQETIVRSFFVCK